jgi:LCP family protein required for cell wall assembly
VRVARATAAPVESPAVARSGEGKPSDVPSDSATQDGPRAEDTTVPTRLPGRDPIWARVSLVFGVLLILLSGGVLGAGKVLASRYDHSVKKQTLIAEDARVEVRPQQRSRIVGPLNFLLLGSDARPDSPGDGQRADTVIIAHVPASLDKVYLISIPRDLRVEIPPYPPTGFGGGREKINSAFEYGGAGSGGVQLLSMTLARLMDIRFDGAAVVDFAGFQSVVKALGGVDMCIDHRVVSVHWGFDEKGKYKHPRLGGKPMVYEPGCRRLNDWQALDYVRQRYSLPDGDYGRMRHQQQFLRALFERAREEGVATNPIKADQIIRAVAGTLTVDTGGVPLEALMFGLRDIRPSSLMGVSVPSEPRWIGNTSYIVALDEAEGLYRAIAEDTVDTWILQNPSWVNRL